MVISNLPNNSQRGFTLIGLLIAALILSVIALAASGLLTQANQTANTARQQFIALNLAREGLELVHAVRDTNWFTSDDRSLWLEHGLCTTNGVSSTDSNRQFLIDAKRVQNSDTVLPVASGALYLEPGTNEWTHDVTSIPTPYKRIMSIDCSQKDSDPAVVTVTSTVSWPEGNKTRTVILKEQLYNWLPSQRKINP